MAYHFFQIIAVFSVLYTALTAQPGLEMIIPTIMCGGAGTRLWPSSRDSLPKHLIALFDGLSTFQMTVLRFKDHEGFGRPVVITSADQRFLIGAQLAAIGASADIILEPSRQDSAAAVATGAVHLSTRETNTICLMLAADHKVNDASAFRAACLTAAVAAKDGLIMTLGITPTAPATGYGYISLGESVAANCYRISEFREKPDAATAAEYIARGYFWNSGNFLFRPDVMVTSFTVHAPEILAAARGAYDGATRDADFIRLDASIFRTAPKNSVDFAIMEKTDAAGVTPCDAGWSDIGTWDALWEASEQDASGNAVTGDVVLLDTHDSLIRSDGPLVAAVGVTDLVIVANRDAVMVSPQSRVAEVKKIVETLKSQGRSEAVSHARLHYPWGWRERLDRDAGFTTYRLQVSPDGEMVAEASQSSVRHWALARGDARVNVGETSLIMRAGETFSLVPGIAATLINRGDAVLELIEVEVAIGRSG